MIVTTVVPNNLSLVKNKKVLYEKKILHWGQSKCAAGLEMHHFKIQLVCVCVCPDKLLGMVIYYTLVHGKSPRFPAFPSTKRVI